jgi:hypothetical protein
METRLEEFCEAQRPAANFGKGPSLSGCTDAKLIEELSAKTKIRIKFFIFPSFFLVTD